MCAACAEDELNSVNGSIGGISGEKGSDCAVFGIVQAAIESLAPGMVEQRTFDGQQQLPVGGEDLDIVRAHIGYPERTRAGVEGFVGGSFRTRISHRIKEMSWSS